MLVCFVVIFTSINVFWSFAKEEEVKFDEKFFQAKFLSRLSHKVFRQPRPQSFSLKKWVGGKTRILGCTRRHVTSRCQGLFPPHPFFERKALGTRLVFRPVTESIYGLYALCCSYIIVLGLGIIVVFFVTSLGTCFTLSIR